MAQRPRRRPRGRWAVFLDRDGTLLRLVPYLKSASRARLYDGAVRGLKSLQDRGALLVVVTNQSGLARGLMNRRDVGRLHAHLKSLLAEGGVRLAAIEVCPHHPDFTGPCRCRKPRPGMILQAARRLSIDLERSWLVGDSLSDLKAGWAAGTRVALVLTGYGRRTRSLVGRNVAVGGTLSSVARMILKSLPGRGSTGRR